MSQENNAPLMSAAPSHHALVALPEYWPKTMYLFKSKRVANKKRKLAKKRF